MGPLLSMLPTILKTGASVFANRQKAKILMSDAELLHAQKMATGEVEYQAQIRQSNDQGYKDEFVLILVSAPVLLLIWSVFSGDPDIQMKLDLFFEKLAVYLFGISQFLSVLLHQYMDLKQQTL